MNGVDSLGLGQVVSIGRVALLYGDLNRQVYCINYTGHRNTILVHYWNNADIIILPPLGKVHTEQFYVSYSNCSPLQTLLQ